MESTGIYWIPVWCILEDEFEIKPVNPYFIKQIPGRKTDVIERSKAGKRYMAINIYVVP